MRQQDVIAGSGGGAILPTFTWSQTKGQRRLRIPLVYGAAHPGNPVTVETLRLSQRDHGWTYGQDLAIDPRFGDGGTVKMRRPTEGMRDHKPDIVLA